MDKIIAYVYGAVITLIITFIVGLIALASEGHSERKLKNNACLTGCLERGYPKSVYMHKPQACWCWNNKEALLLDITEGDN